MKTMNIFKSLLLFALMGKLVLAASFCEEHAKYISHLLYKSELGMGGSLYKAQLLNHVISPHEEATYLVEVFDRNTSGGFWITNYLVETDKDELNQCQAISAKKIGIIEDKSPMPCEEDARYSAFSKYYSEMGPLQGSEGVDHHAQLVDDYQQEASYLVYIYDGNEDGDAWTSSYLVKVATEAQACQVLSTDPIGSVSNSDPEFNLYSL